MPNPKINNINVGGVDYDIGSTVLSFETYDDYLDAHEAGDIPVGSTVFIKEGNQSLITANQVSYGNSTVKDALDQINDDLSDKADKSDLTDISLKLPKKVEYFDYANARTITLPYTCTENGLFIAILGDGASAGTRDIIINGTQVAILTASSNGARETASFIVSTGDVISSGIAFWGTCKFIPTKS